MHSEDGGKSFKHHNSLCSVLEWGQLQPNRYEGQNVFNFASQFLWSFRHKATLHFWQNRLGYPTHRKTACPFSSRRRHRLAFFRILFIGECLSKTLWNRWGTGSSPNMEQCLVFARATSCNFLNCRKIVTQFQIVSLVFRFGTKFWRRDAWGNEVDFSGSVCCFYRPNADRKPSFFPSDQHQLFGCCFWIESESENFIFPFLLR